MTTTLPTVRRTQTRMRTAVAGVITCSLAAGVVLVGAAAPAEAATRWQSGVYTGECGKTPVTKFGSWRHAHVERTSGYFVANRWSQMSNVGVVRCLAAAKLPMTLSVGLLPSSGGSLVAGSKGSYNAYWRAFGKSVVHNGGSHVTFRLGWEFNGAWFKWSAAKDPKHWAAYWRQIVKTLRKVPGEHFSFEWSPGLGANSTNLNPARAWPGAGYVNYVGASVYDVWYGSGSASAYQRWHQLEHEKYGLAWLAAFAKKKHKHIGISEWGLASRGSFAGHGNGDNAYFIRHFYAWMKRVHVRYDVYFNRQHGANEHRLAIGTSSNGAFSKAGAAYRRSFGGM